MFCGLIFISKVNVLQLCCYSGTLSLSSALFYVFINSFESYINFNVAPCRSFFFGSYNRQQSIR